MTALLGKKSLCHTGYRICWVLVELCTGSADWGGFAGNPHAGGLFMQGFFGEGRRGGGAAATGREQAMNTHSGTFHDPGATSGKISITSVLILYLYLQNKCHIGNWVS